MTNGLDHSTNDRVDRAAASKVRGSKPPDPRLRVQRYVLAVFVLKYIANRLSFGPPVMLVRTRHIVCNIRDCERSATEKQADCDPHYHQDKSGRGLIFQPQRKTPHRQKTEKK